MPKAGRIAAQTSLLTAEFAALGVGLTNTGDAPLALSSTRWPRVTLLAAGLIRLSGAFGAIVPIIRSTGNAVDNARNGFIRPTPALLSASSEGAAG
ncbi:MAG: hypothetical protein IPN21_18910 [Burkholderiales bacterium]|nr:hypothetical protein [Burkholderiales bacterium]